MKISHKAHVKGRPADERITRAEKTSVLSRPGGRWGVHILKKTEGK
jgi:hypothetical protein